MSIRKKLKFVENLIAAEIAVCLDVHILTVAISVVTLPPQQWGTPQKSREWFDLEG
jgi:hypothetical protein